MKERKNMFVESVQQVIKLNFTDFPSDLAEEFVDYWTEANENGRKMRFEKQKTFNIKRRLKTFLRNSKKWSNPKKIQKKLIDESQIKF